jgi:hypothetical protein
MCQSSDDKDAEVKNDTSSVSLHTEDMTEQQQQDKDSPHTRCEATKVRLIDFYFKYEFLIHIVVVIALARAYPPLGADYLYPEITATWYVSNQILLDSLTITLLVCSVLTPSMFQDCCHYHLLVGGPRTQDIRVFQRFSTSSIQCNRSNL